MDTQTVSVYISIASLPEDYDLQIIKDKIVAAFSEYEKVTVKIVTY